MSAPGAGWHALSRARERSAGSKTSSTRSIRTCCQCGTPSGMPVPGAGPCNGSLITRSLMTALRIAFLTDTQIPPCPEPSRCLDRRAVMRPCGTWSRVPGTPGRKTRHPGSMRRVVILGRGAAGKSTLARHLGDLTGLPVTEVDTMVWQRGLTRAEPAGWAARQRELCSRDSWIIDGDLGPYDQDLGMRLRAADTIIVLDLAFPRVAWRTLRRGRERADYWR